MIILQENSIKYQSHPIVWGMTTYRKLIKTLKMMRRGIPGFNDIGNFGVHVSYFFNIYPTKREKENHHLQKCRLVGDMLVPWRVYMIFVELVF